MQPFDLVVVGGGPAGFFGAIRFKQLCPLARVLIVEKDSLPLRKLLQTGGGRCNITHACPDPREFIKSYPRGGKFLLGALFHFGPDDLLNWFEDQGLDFYCDPQGCYFPITDRAQSVVDILLDRAKKIAIEIRTQVSMEDLAINLQDNSCLIGLSSGDQVYSSLVLIATGDNRKALEVVAKLGIPQSPVMPALFAFKLQEPGLAQLAGITVERVGLRLPLTPFAQAGTLLITHRGLSGPVVINLSSWAARHLHDAGYRHALQVDWLDGIGDQGSSNEILKQYKRSNSTRRITALSPFPALSLRLWQWLVLRSQIPEQLRWGDLSKVQMAGLNLVLRAGLFAICGRDAHKQEFVTCGGVQLDAIDAQGFECRDLPGLCFAGEVLDIDGLTGGYNLQNCWTSAWLAGERLAGRYAEIHTDNRLQIG